MKLAILGSGKIVEDFLSFIHEVDGIDLVAIASTKRSFEKCKKLAKENGIENAYENFDKMLENKEIDTVYVAVPNFLHFEMVKKALENSKNVICEKPFTSNYKQLEELIKISGDKKLILLEAISNIHLKNVKEIEKDLPKLGNIKIVSLNYSQYSSRYDAFKRGELASVFDINKDGGALGDLNIYNLQFLVELFGKPKDIVYFANIEKGVDTSGVLNLDYNTFKAVAIGAKDCKAPVFSSIQGDLGSIIIDNAPNEIKEYKLILNDGKEELKNVSGNYHRMKDEFVEFEKIISTNNFEKSRKKLEQSLIVMELLTRARKSAGIVFNADK